MKQASKVRCGAMVAFCAGVVAGCAGAQVPDSRLGVELGTTDSVASPADAGLLAVVVREVKDGARGKNVRVDPRPLLPGRGAPASEPGSFMGLDRRYLDLRRDTLLAIGVDTVNAEAVGQNDQCGTPFMPTDSLGNSLHKGCPANLTYVVAVGLARPGRATLEHGRLYDRSRGAAVGYWAVPVIVTSMDKWGATVNGYEYVLKRENGEWRFVEKHALFVAD